LAGVSVVSTGHLIVVNPRVNLPNGLRPNFGDRGEINSLSQGSATRMRRYLRESIADYAGFVTLTYPFGHGFSAGQAKRDLKVMLQRMHRFSRCDPRWSIFWFMEFQERGSIHFHLFVTSRYPKEWIAKSWYEVCRTDDPRHLQAGTRIESIRSGKRGLSSYAAKYAAKQKQKLVPANFGWVGRFWGVVGLRGRTSADVFVTPQDCLSNAFKKRVMTVESTINRAIHEKKIRKMKDSNGGTTVYYVMDDMLLPIIRMQIALCNITASLYRSKTTWIWPELEEDLLLEDDDGIKNPTERARRIA
jgi:hypothetical protein